MKSFFSENIDIIGALLIYIVARLLVEVFYSWGMPDTGGLVIMLIAGMISTVVIANRIRNHFW